MAHDDDRAAVLVSELAQQPGEVSAARGVEVGGGFVREQNGWVIGERACDCDALLFAAGHLGGPRRCPVGKADALEQLGGAVAGGASGGAGEIGGNCDVLGGR